MKKSILSLSAIALASSLLVACNEDEELVPKMDPAKPTAEAPADQPAGQATEQAAEQPKADEPELVPIQSLSGNAESAEAAKAEEPAKNFVPAAAGGVQPLSKGEYVIQVSIQSSKRAANGIVSKLAENGIKAYVAEVENPGELEGTYYRIRVGYFESSANAQEYGKQVLTPTTSATPAATNTTPITLTLILILITNRPQHPSPNRLLLPHRNLNPLRHRLLLLSLNPPRHRLLLRHPNLNRPPHRNPLLLRHPSLNRLRLLNRLLLPQLRPQTTSTTGNKRKVTDIKKEPFGVPFFIRIKKRCQAKPGITLKTALKTVLTSADSGLRLQLRKG